MTDDSVPPNNQVPSEAGAVAPGEIVPTTGADPIVDLTGVDPGPQTDRSKRRAAGWLPWVVGVTSLLMVAGGIAGSAAVRTDEVLFAPGSVRGTADRVTIEGATSYPIKGDVLFATVSVRQATLFDTLFRRRLDDTLRFTDIDDVYPDGDKASVDAANESAMNDSKTVASVVALRHLGRKVTFTGDGVAIVKVSPDLPADGLLQPGDLLVGADGRRLQLTDDLQNALAPKKPGDAVELTVIRGGAKPNDQAHGNDASKGVTDSSEAADKSDEEQVRVPLVAGEEGRAIMGVQVADHNLDVKLPMEINFDSGEVTGPSAGLAWTLAIVDELTPDDLTNGKRVAATGTIGPNGEVGPIGGLPQKTAAVRRSGAELFLIPKGLPADDLAQAKQLAGGEVDLVEVATLDEAVDAIEKFVGD